MGEMLNTRKSSQMTKMFAIGPAMSNMATDQDRAYHGSTGSRSKNIPTLRIILAANKASSSTMKMLTSLSAESKQ
jgi:hypothetical protein